MFLNELSGKKCNQLCSVGFLTDGDVKWKYVVRIVGLVMKKNL